jgi:CRP/FNR family transcriptional regulator, cyclic AMP receptor protein
MTKQWIDLHLAQAALFAGSSDRDLGLVSDATTEVAVPAGTVLTEHGAIGHELFVIVEGTATVHRGGEVIATRGPGDHVGEIALLGPPRRTATVVAETAMTVLVLPRRELRALEEDVPGLAERLAAAAHR